MDRMGFQDPGMTGVRSDGFGGLPSATERVMAEEEQREQRWLRRLVGDWSYGAETAPGQPSGTHGGTEHARLFGGAWAVCEGEYHTPDGESGATMMTLGYDPARARFVGSFIGSMMPHLW